jgi:lysyl-tRNA synthetase class II
MDFCESMLRAVVFKALGHTHVKFGEHDLDFAKPFERISMREAVLRVIPNMFFLKELPEEIDAEWLQDPWKQEDLLTFFQWFINKNWVSSAPSTTWSSYSTFIDKFHEDSVKQWRFIRNSAVHSQAASFESLVSNLFELSADVYRQLRLIMEHSESVDEGKGQVALFRHLVKSHLTSPTLITDFPKSISPLSKASPADPTVAERFELYIAGMECANGFSELNDPVEQYERFNDQMQQRERGDEEAMVMDEDYIRALSYGMPPAAGIGIGIDRFVMLLTNRQSIRDVILFPHLRPERKTAEEES